MFGKNKTKTAEEVLDIINGLSVEEKTKLLSALTSVEAEGEAQTEERGEEDVTAEQTETDVLDESVGEQEHLDGNEDSQSAEDRIDEAEEAEEVSDEPEVKNDDEDRYAALTARIDALEAMFNEYRQSQEQAVEEERDQDFGMSPSTPDGGQEDNDRYKRVMRGYAKNNSNQYL